jgi:hypothetical protein
MMANVVTDDNGEGCIRMAVCKGSDSLTIEERRAKKEHIYKRKGNEFTYHNDDK